MAAGTGGSGLGGIRSDGGDEASGSASKDAASTPEMLHDATPSRADAGAPLSGITLLYKCTDTNPNDSQIGPSYRIVNAGGATVSLADFKIRYFLSDEGKAKLLSDFVYAEVNGGAGYRDIRSDVPVTIGAAASPAAGADTTVELGFTAAAGTLTDGQTMTVNFVVHTDGYASSLDESNDYSHDLTKTDFGPNPKVTLYYRDQLVLGTEP
jgi:cellulose 1,4-beta-cellobiosidase